MDRLRRSFRDSFRRRKDRVPESSKPHQWQADEQAVRSATCSFQVKYLGCVEVFESRGMQVCEEALKVLRNSRRRPIRGLLHVSGDGLRVVDEETKGLIVDQTIEKVSFCAPDRNHERGFSYICRDGTTRRWMCHGFLATKDSGERLSHAVGCAFAVCLERKQRRDRDCGVTMTFDAQNSTFTRTGSFRQQTLTERLANNERGIDTVQTPSAIVPPQPKPYNPFAIERPHATPSMLERQGSFRIGSQSPFKRQMSLRINDLPSNAERQKAFLDAGGASLTTPQRTVSPIPEISPKNHVVDTVSQLCQELSQGLSLLTQNDVDDLNFNNKMSINQNITDKTPSPLNGNDGGSITPATILQTSSIVGLPTSQVSTSVIASTEPTIKVLPTAQVSPRSRYSITAAVTAAPVATTTTILSSISSILPQLGTITSTTSAGIIPTTVTSATEITTTSTTAISAVTTSTTTQRILPVETVSPLPKPDQWLGQVVKSTSPAPRRAPLLGTHGRAKSLSSAITSDPFDAEWASGVTKPTSSEMHSTNPFISPPKPPAQSFQVQL